MLVVVRAFVTVAPGITSPATAGRGACAACTAAWIVAFSTAAACHVRTITSLRGTAPPPHEAQTAAEIVAVPHHAGGACDVDHAKASDGTMTSLSAIARTLSQKRSTRGQGSRGVGPRADGLCARLGTAARGEVPSRRPRAAVSEGDNKYTD